MTDAMQTETACSECGAALRATDRYCSQCGTAVKASPAPANALVTTGRKLPRLRLKMRDGLYVVVVNEREALHLPKEAVDRALKAGATAAAGYVARRRKGGSSGPRA